MASDTFAQGLAISALSQNETLSAEVTSLAEALQQIQQSGVKFKGAVNYKTDLPSTGVKVGDMYVVKYQGTSGTVPYRAEFVCITTTPQVTYEQLGLATDVNIVGTKIAFGDGFGEVVGDTLIL